MTRIALCQDNVILSLIQNGKAIILPNGMTVCGPLKTLPKTVAEYTLLNVIEQGPLPGQGEVGVAGVPTIVDNVVVIERTVIPASSDRIIEQLLAYVSHRRWVAEVGGVIWNTWRVATDREASQSKISASYALARDGYWPEGSGWKFGDEVFRVITAEQMIAMALTVAAHIQACFALEHSLRAEVTAETVTSKAQIDAAFAALEPAPT